MEIDARLRGPRLYESRKHAGLRPLSQSQLPKSHQCEAGGQWARVRSKGPAPFEWRLRVTRSERLCQKVEGERFGCHYGQKCLILDRNRGFVDE